MPDPHPSLVDRGQYFRKEADTGYQQSSYGDGPYTYVFTVDEARPKTDRAENRPDQQSETSQFFDARWLVHRFPFQANRVRIPSSNRSLPSRAADLLSEEHNFPTPAGPFRSA